MGVAATVELVLDAVDDDVGLDELDGGAELLLLEEDDVGVEEVLEDVSCSFEDDDGGGGGGGDHVEDVVI